MRLDKEIEKQLTPKRMEYALMKIKSKGYNPIESECGIKIEFERVKGKKVVLFVYSGWYSGKGIGSGRGIENLLKLI